MRQESAPQYALGKNLLMRQKRVVKTLLPQKLFLFSVVKEKNKQVLLLSKQRKIRVDTKIEF